MVSSSAKACPNCGKPAARKTSVLTMIVAALFAVFIANVVTSPPKSTEPTKVVPDSRLSNLETTQVKAEDTENPSSWITSEYKDPMTDERIKSYTVKSINSVEFDFPYNVPGGSHLYLTFRKGGKAPDAYFKIEKGQILCGYSDCKFAMRVDGGKQAAWKGLASSTHNPDVMFISDFSKIEALAKNGSKIRVGLDFFKFGTQSFDFDLSEYPAK